MTAEPGPGTQKAIDASVSNLMQEIAQKGGYDCTGCQQPKRKEPHQIGVFFSEQPEPRLTVYPLCKVCALKAKVDRDFKANVIARVKESVAQAIASGQVVQPSDRPKEFTTADYKVVREEKGEVHVRFPSGKNFKMKGIFRIMDFPDRGVNPTMEDEAGKLFMLDPRALVTMDGKNVYRPRSYKLAPEMDQWLKDHPEWAPEPS